MATWLPRWLRTRTRRPAGSIVQPAHPKTPRVRVEQLEVVYNHVQLAVQGLSMQVRDREIVAVLGTNGAGKTTTLRAITGCLPGANAAVTDGRVLFECPKGLVRLLTGCLGVDELIPEGTPLPEFDVQAPLLSLPGIFQTRLETIPAMVPYIFPEVAALKHWREALKHIKGFRVGIAWQGNRVHKYDRQRSIALRHFERLARIPGVQLISLQKGQGAEQLDADLPFAVRELGRYAMDFADTAAMIKQLDLVISCDSAVVHLAGGLNVNTWVALPFSPDWRWLLEREDSPWYPSLRLFRQRRLGDWADVFARIEVKLRERVQASSARG